MSAPATALPVSGYALRAWRTSDAADMQHHLNNLSIAPHMADWYPLSGYTLAMAEEWVTGGADAFGGTSWAITFNDRAVGGCGVHPGQGFARCNAEIGYWLSEQHWGRGVGSAVVTALTSFAFALAGVTRVFAPIHASNPRSQRICEKAGFTCEGLRRLSVMKAGQAIDTVVWAAYRDTWKAS
jgi:[ribosomal protein S5]-alanine N-acetyltransferase